MKKHLYAKHRELISRKFARSPARLYKRERMQLARVRRQLDRIEIRESQAGFTRMKRMLRAFKRAEMIMRRLAAQRCDLCGAGIGEACICAMRKRATTEGMSR